MIDKVFYSKTDLMIERNRIFDFSLFFYNEFIRKENTQMQILDLRSAIETHGYKYGGGKVKAFTYDDAGGCFFRSA